MGTHPTYKIQTIPHNLSKEETVVQMVEILDHLNAITQDIFSRVNKRLELNTEKLSNISERIDAAAAKVENLKGDKKAKTVFSSSKYPAANVVRDYVSIFKEPCNVERVRHKVNYTKHVSTYEPLSKLQFYHVKMPDQKSKQFSEGLGDIPQDTKHINDLLLFNTGKNVYKDFKEDTLVKSSNIVMREETFATSELGPAPLSISQRSSMQQAHKDNLFYTPKIEELPALDVPLDLPDLPGIADDLRYSFDSDPILTPSAAVNTSQIENLDLPNILEDKTESEAVSPPPPPLPPPVIPEPPPVHELPKPDVQLTLEIAVKQQDDYGTVGHQAEVPESTVDSGTKAVIEQTLAPVPPQPAGPILVDSRASLMDAIRQAGGSQKANLRRISDESKAAPKRSTSSPGDLMADLHSKLMMRRKGISGAKKEAQDNSVTAGSGDSAFARLSAIIPPPSKNSDLGSEASTDDDAWNDEDDR